MSLSSKYFKLHFLICFFVLMACNSTANNSVSEKDKIKDDLKAVLDSNFGIENVSDERHDSGLNSTEEIAMDDEMLATGYVVICDTALDYNFLLNKMRLVSKTLKIKIDSMGRFYDAKLNKIRLPDDSEDEIYAGEYYPRRNFETFLSIEYASQYIDGVSDSLMVLVSGIFIEEDKARSQLKQIMKTEKNAFIQKSSIYLGCLH